MDETAPRVPKVDMKKRILMDISQIATAESDYILIDGDNLELVKCVITGPLDSPFEGGLFEVNLGLKGFPAEPPKVTFETAVYHPNVENHTGKVCMSILDQKEWAPATTLLQVLNAARRLLQEPNPSSPLNGSAAALLRVNPQMYEDTNRMWTYCFAGGDVSRVAEDMLLKLDNISEVLGNRERALRKLTKCEWDERMVFRH